MQTINTVRVNQEWLEAQIRECGGASNFARILGVDPSTVSRQINMKAEASPRFIGAVLAKIAVSFQDAFDVTEEEVRVHRARMLRTTAA
ncbi:hypothetical protein HMPREF3155_11600 [Corynebacterium sp. HMSC06D04]|nr:hypothetical protein HMPREF2935_07300 [Corynebacterium sp. HMSC076D02]OFT49520.1 hypothetical protein HMPREF3155_11600 [Corynebacterium sp. HMSC06D04]OHO69070.1 hypothetical protein HMPREF2692_12230 [Corynebacterium sp. HMSC036D03]